MNTGMFCVKCGSHRVHARLTKVPNKARLTIELVCLVCKSMEEIDVTSFGFELFEPITLQMEVSSKGEKK